MREIKFRVWDTEKKKMSFVGAIDWNNPNDPPITCNTRDNKLYRYPPEELLLMQYTGIKDKRGKEIYEGDIVQLNELDEGAKKVVRWDEEESRFAYGDKAFTIKCYTCKVIGHIHEENK